MGKIEELKKKLYSKNFSSRKRVLYAPLEKDETKSADRAWLFGEKELKQLELKKKKHHYLMMILGFLIGLSAFAAGVFWFLQSGILLNFFGKTEVKLSISAPLEIFAGDRVTYEVVYENKSNNTLKAVELFFDYPRDAELAHNAGENTDELLNVKMPLEDLPPGATRRLDFSARLFGKEGDELFSRAILKYTPDNITSRLETREEHRLTIVKVPITVEFASAEKVLAGESRQYTIEYVSNASLQFHNIALRVITPDGFQIEDFGTEPFHKENREFIWDLGNISSGSSGSINIRGVLSGSPLEPKTFQYGLGVYNKETKSWKPYIERFAISEIIAPPLAAEILLQGKRDLSLAFGESVPGEITIKNNSNIPLRNLIVTAEFEGPIDTGWLRSQNGAIIGSNAIQWKVANDAELQLLDVGESHKLFFSFNVLRANRIGSLKNTNIKAHVSVAAEKDIIVDFTPEGKDTIIASVKAIPYFATKAIYSGTIISNTGPIPPKVGQETTYAVIMELGSFGSNLTDVMVRASLPPYMKWKNLIVPAVSPIIYNSATNEIIWSVGTVSAGDLDSATKKVSFQLGLTPAPSQAGSTMEILKNINMRGVDEFTKSDILLNFRSLDTDLKDDFGVPLNSGKIIE